MATAEFVSAPPHDHGAPGAARDPVCGMSVDPATERHRTEHAGETYLFCGAECRERFVTEPARYLAGAPPQPSAPERQAGQTLWTCPMHPQIVRHEPDLRHGAGADDTRRG